MYAPGNSGTTTALGPLIKLKEDNDGYVRRAVKEAIEKIHTKTVKTAEMQ